MLKHFRSGSKRIRTLWWVLTIGTVVTFIGGFVVFGQAPGDSGARSATDVVAKVGDQEVRQMQLASAELIALSNYAGQYGSQPVGNDAALVREQAWTNLLAERAVDRVAQRYGMKVGDSEVVYAAKFSPPPDVTMEPTLMTNGRFDRSKWQQVLADPSRDFSPLEERIRDLLPGQRLEERIIAGVKISEPELQRLFATQYDRVKISFVFLPLDTAPIDTTKLSDTVLRKYYDDHKAEFTSPAQVHAELVQVPVTVDSLAENIARTDTEAMVKEIRAGIRSFEDVAKERSEGPYSQAGGDMGQDVPMSRLPQTLQTLITALEPGQITDPVRDGNTYFIFKLISRSTATDGAPMVRLAQIQKPVRPSGESMQKDIDAIAKLRTEAAKQPLAGLAAKRQLVSVNSGWFAQGQYVPMLVQMPQAQMWALSAKKGEVSRAYGTETGWVLIQVTDRREAGPRPYADAKDDVRRAVEVALRQEKPRLEAQKIVDATRAGQSLEQAAAAFGATVAATDTFPRSRPHAALSPAPRAVGYAFGLPVGKVGGPILGPGGAYVIRKDILVPGDPMQYQQLKGQLSSQLLSARQQRWVRSWIEKTVAETKVVDMRNPIEPVL